MTKKIKQPPKSKKSSSFAPPNGLPMVHVVMDAGGPRLSPSQVSPSREKPSVTILTVKQVYRRPNEPTSELTLVFANRERALAAMRSHLTNSDADTTRASTLLRPAAFGCHSTMLDVRETRLT